MNEGKLGKKEASDRKKREKSENKHNRGRMWEGNEK